MDYPGKSSSTPKALPDRLKSYGCTTIVVFDEDSINTRKFAPEQLDYLDLLVRPQTFKATGNSRLAAAVRHQGATLLYVVDAPDGGALDVPARAELQRLLANRSEPAWLGICTPGELQIFPIGFHAGESEDLLPVETIRADDAEAPLFFQSLVQGSFKGKEGQWTPGNDLVFEEIKKLLEQTTKAWVPGKKILPLHILSMAGRALFFRFLVDRKIVRDEDVAEISAALGQRDKPDLKDAFSTAEIAAQTSVWLDATFNGDFLPLIDDGVALPDVSADAKDARLKAYLQFYERIASKTRNRFFYDLTAILKGWRNMSGASCEFQTELSLDWDDLKFEHIPVGVLSQVYEHFSHQVDYEEARSKSVHYTPRLIAELMMNQTFAAIPAARRATARVLDPSSGAGIFLVLAFRRLVRERWERDGERPNTKKIQHILYEQLRGYDISEAALRLAALSLYITAIELNATQRPPAALRFPKNLRNRVLFNTSNPSDASPDEIELGSLGPYAPHDEDGSFDLVIGNPPWTRHREKTPVSKGTKKGKTQSDLLNDAYTEIARRVLAAKELPGLANAYENPDKNPDFPFIWRAMEWAKPGGLIAFTVPGRIYTHTEKDEGKGRAAWESVISSISLTGLINGADLRWSAVWKDIKVPFGLLFARNARPAPDHRFVFTAPANDPAPNALGRFRIDYQSARPISVERVKRQPWVLKTLTLGTWQDVETMEAILAAFPQTLAQFWAAWNPAEDKTGQGYNRSPDLKQKQVDFLGKLLDFVEPTEGFDPDYDAFKTYHETWSNSSANMPRTASLYQPPLVIVPKSPGDDLNKPRAFYAERPLAFSQIYYGYSCDEYPDADTLAALIYLIPHSTLFRYFSLMISESQGADRMMFTKGDLDALPFPDVARLSSSDARQLRALARRLRHDNKKPWNEIDAFIFDLYRLDEIHREVIRDTLFSAAAYRRAGRDALDRTTAKTRTPFRDALHEQLAPFFDVTRQQIEIAEPPAQPGKWEDPWCFITIALAGQSVTVNPALLRAAMREADKSGASRIIVRAPRNAGLLVGLLNQRRWWTPTRARICGRDIIRRYLDTFGVTDPA